MIACERKFEEEEGDAEQRVRAVEAQWGKWPVLYNLI